MINKSWLCDHNEWPGW